MKATGIVRRIDDLGRVVIPKEIRRTMRIREGDPLEIFTSSGGEVVFKKYSPIGELGGFAAQYAESLAKGTDLSVVICDRDQCVAAAGIPKKEVIERRIAVGLEEMMESRKSITETGRGQALEGTSREICVAMPIICAGDVCGAVVLLENGEVKSAAESDIKLAQVAATFLGKQMED